MVSVFEYEAFPNYGMGGVGGFGGAPAGFQPLLTFLLSSVPLFFLIVLFVVGSTVALCPSVNMERDSPGQLVHIHTQHRIFVG